MQIARTLSTVIAGFVLITSSVHAQPTYADAESKRVVEAMVEAHGGIERWRAIESIRFDNVMHNNYHGKN